MTSATSPGFRRGVRIGVDVGTVRVGVARTDPDGVLAVPVATLTRPKAARAPRSDLAALVDLVTEYEPLEVVLGLPVALDGTEGLAAAAVRAYAADLRAALDAAGHDQAIRFVDERMSTVEASRGLRAAGRDARSGRSVVDQAAAVIIVQHALDAERSTGGPPGTVFQPEPDDLPDAVEDPA
jgi:putative Holliday junction resolvase